MYCKNVIIMIGQIKLVVSNRQQLKTKYIASYTAKLSSGKIFTVVRKIHYSLETFAVHQAVAIMYCTQQVIQREDLQSAEKLRK